MNNYERKTKELICEVNGLIDKTIKVSGISALDVLRTNPEKVDLLTKAIHLYDELIDYLVENGKFMDIMITKMEILEQQNSEMLEILRKQEGRLK